MLFSNGKINNDPTLIVGIESNLISLTLAIFKENSPQILYVTTEPISYKDSGNADYVTKMMLKSLGSIFERLTKEASSMLGPVKEVHYVLSSPWIISHSKSLKIHNDAEIEASDKMLQSVINEERQSLMKKYEADLVFVEQKIFDIKLNGYQVETYKGKRAKDIEVLLVLTLSSDKIIKRINAAVSKFIHIKREIHHSALLLHYMAVRSSVKSGEEYIVIHIHGEITDIVIVKRGFSSFFASFPFGTSTLAKKMASSMKISQETGESIISLFENDKLEATQKKGFEKVFGNIMEGWKSECLKALSGMDKDAILPKKIYLSSQNHFNIFKDILDKSQFEIVSFNKPLIEIYILALKNML